MLYAFISWMLKMLDAKKCYYQKGIYHLARFAVLYFAVNSYI